MSISVEALINGSAVETILHHWSPTGSLLTEKRFAWRQLQKRDLVNVGDHVKVALTLSGEQVRRFHTGFIRGDSVMISVTQIFA